jgi:hypothetical protein
VRGVRCQLKSFKFQAPTFRTPALGA